MTRKTVCRLIILLACALLDSCSYKQVEQSGQLSPQITELKVEASDQVPMSLLRAFYQQLPAQTSKGKTKNSTWQLSLKHFSQQTDTMAASANAHIIIKRVSMSLCFLLINGVKNVVIPNTCISQSASYPFDSNKTLSFDIQREQHKARLENALAKQTINMINLKLR
jgi:hypothetical protein